MNYNLGDTANVRAGFRIYTTAATTTVTSQGYSNSILALVWTQTTGAFFSLASAFSVLVATVIMFF